MSNALSIYNQFEQIKGAALALQKSGFFKDVTSEAQAIVKVMAGAELGLPPFASMTGISIIQGKPVLGANLIATLIKNDPRYDYRIVTATNDECLIEFFENGQSVGKTGFTMTEAQNAGLTGKDNWKKYPSDMLFARAISRGAKRHSPGIFGGSPVYTADEMGVDVDPDGYVDVQVIESEPEPQDNLRMFNSSIKSAIVEKGFADNPFAAANMLDHSNLPDDVTAGVAVAWARNYRTARNEGSSVVEATELANSAYSEYIANN